MEHGKQLRKETQLSSFQVFVGPQLLIGTNRAPLICSWLFLNTATQNILLANQLGLIYHLILQQLTVVPKPSSISIAPQSLINNNLIPCQESYKIKYRSRPSPGYVQPTLSIPGLQGLKLKLPGCLI